MHPTYIGALLGTTMPNMNNNTAKIILLQKFDRGLGKDSASYNKWCRQLLLQIGGTIVMQLFSKD